jgi:hypothetical protein
LNPPFLLISIIGQNRQKFKVHKKSHNISILSQKVPKFELYKHNDELFNKYYGIFYVLWTFAYFDRWWKLVKRGDSIFKKSSAFEEISIFSHGGHLGYRTALTDTILKGNHPRIISAKFGWDRLSSFRGEDFFLISSSLFSNLHNRSK